MKMKISARWRHCSKIFKTNLKTHISPLLNRPQGWLSSGDIWFELEYSSKSQCVSVPPYFYRYLLQTVLTVFVVRTAAAAAVPNPDCPQTFE